MLTPAPLPLLPPPGPMPEVPPPPRVPVPEPGFEPAEHPTNTHMPPSHAVVRNIPEESATRTSSARCAQCAAPVMLHLPETITRRLHLHKVWKGDSPFQIFV